MWVLWGKGKGARIMDHGPGFCGEGSIMYGKVGVCEFKRGYFENITFLKRYVRLLHQTLLLT
jgi:hypothetical protein